MTDLEQELIRNLRDLITQTDDGPRDCVGVMEDGTWTWKGSYLARIERLRALLPAPKAEEPDPRVTFVRTDVGSANCLMLVAMPEPETWRIDAETCTSRIDGD